MGNKRKLQRKIKKVQKKPNAPVQKQVNIQELLASIDARVNNKINSAIKTMIFPLKALMDRRYKEYMNLTANVMALQTILKKAEMLDEKEFKKEYEEIITEVIGRVDNEGKMTGYCGVEIYNMEEESEDSIH